MLHQLLGEGSEIFVAETAAGAFDLLNQFIPHDRPDLILVNRRLPDGSSLAVVSAVSAHQACAHVPTLVDYRLALRRRSTERGHRRDKVSFWPLSQIFSLLWFPLSFPRSAQFEHSHRSAGTCLSIRLSARQRLRQPGCENERTAAHYPGDFDSAGALRQRQSVLWNLTWRISKN